MIVNLSQLTDEPCHYPDETPGLRGRSKDPGKALGMCQLGLDWHALEPGQANARYHRELTEDEFFLVDEGICQLRLEGQLFTLETGDFVYIPAGQAHQFFNHSPEPCAIWMGGENREGGCAYPEPPATWEAMDGKPPYCANLTRITPQPVQHDGEPIGLRGMALDLSEAVGMQRIATRVHLLAPGQTDFRLHRHQKQEELFIIMAGHPVLHLNDRHVLTRPGDCVRVPPEATHQFLNPGQESAWIWMMKAVSFEPDTHYLEEEQHVGT